MTLLLLVRSTPDAHFDLVFMQVEGQPQKSATPPKASVKADFAGRQRRAISRITRFRKCDCYSITLSAQRRNVSGIVSPSALAVLRLITSSNLVGCTTGKSAGLAPRKSLTS